MLLEERLACVIESRSCSRHLDMSDKAISEIWVCTWCSQPKMYQGKNLTPTPTLTLIVSPNP